MAAWRRRRAAVSRVSSRGQFDVLLRREGRQQVIELEDEADVGRPPVGQFGGGQALDPPPGDPDGAVGRTIQTGDQVEQGALAGAGRPHQGEKVALRDVQVDMVQDLDPFATPLIDLAHTADLDQGGRWPPPSWWRRVGVGG